jgi:GNAT superfamily N-acetyltransferase
MEGEITLRQAIPDDVRAIAEFQTATWNEAYRGLVPQSYLDRTTVEVRQQRWAARTGDRCILLAERGRELVGVGSSSVRTGGDPGPRLELNSLYVAARVRGSGLGERLLEGLLLGAPAVVWAFSANARAVAFYQRCGFAPDGNTSFDTDTGLGELRLTRSTARKL